MGKSGDKQAHTPGKTSADTKADKKSMGSDYWDRIAEDAAKGYKNSGDDKILNEDQISGDNLKAGGELPKQV